MNWSKAKNIIIVILIAMNIGLLICYQYTKTSNYLNAQGEDAIIKLLEQKGIKLSTNIPKDFSPMSQLNLMEGQINTDELKDAFFDKDEEVKISVEFDNTILKNEYKTLTIDGDKVIYVNKINEDSVGEGLDKSLAKKIADQFVKDKLGKEYSDFRYFSVNSKSNSYTVLYYENYNNYKIFSNYIAVAITNKGIASVEVYKYPIEGFGGGTRQICSADEALFTFMNEVQASPANRGLSINKMELGYTVEKNSQKSVNMVAIPCYIISVEGSSKVYYINAYTNTIIEP